MTVEIRVEEIVATFGTQFWVSISSKARTHLGVTIFLVMVAGATATGAEVDK